MQHNTQIWLEVAIPRWSFISLTLENIPNCTTLNISIIYELTTERANHT
jgi:hypothetical protein